MDQATSGRRRLARRLAATSTVAVLASLTSSFRSSCGIVGEVATTGPTTFAAGFRGALAVVGEVAWIAALVSHKNFS